MNWHNPDNRCSAHQPPREQQCYTAQERKNASERGVGGWVGVKRDERKLGEGENEEREREGGKRRRRLEGAICISSCLYTGEKQVEGVGAYATHTQVKHNNRAAIESVLYNTSLLHSTE